MVYNLIKKLILELNMPEDNIEPLGHLSISLTIG